MNIKHTYSYTATYEDGTQIVQDMNEEFGDYSNTKTGGSRFTDVLEKEKESKLVSFVLHNDVQSVGVDLRDGHFEVNGIQFWQHHPDRDNFKNLRIIYYRTVEHVLNYSSGQEEMGYVKGYTIGWQTTHNGKNEKRTVMV